MRIAYLHQYFNTPEMPGGTRSYEMARRLVARGHEVNMVTSWREDDCRRDWFETEEAGIRVHWLPVPYSNKMGFHERIRAFFRFAWGAARKAASSPADVVFATSTPLTISLPAAYAAKRQNIPMVFEVRDLWPELPIAVGALKNPVLRSAARKLERFAYSQSEHIVALSPGMNEGIVKTGFPQDRIAVIPNSCDIDLFQVPIEKGMALRRKFEWLGNRPLVIYAGTFGRINGVGYLAKLAAEMLDMANDVRFLAVGEGYEYENIRNKARELNVLDRNFFMLRQLPKAEMPALFSAATSTMSTFIDLPEMWGNSANKFFDSLAAARPVAINYGGWQADLLRETGAGLVLPPKDIPQAANILAKAIKDREWLKKAGRAAFELARYRFSRERLAGQLEKVLIAAVGSPSGSGPD